MDIAWTVTSVLKKMSAAASASANEGVTTQTIEKQVKESSLLSPVTHLEVTDKSGGCGSAYEIFVVTAAFEGKRLLQRHRLVHEALGETVGKLHALTLKCKTPAESGKN